MRKLTKKEAAALRYIEARKWMDSCGGTISGYIRNYGSVGDPGHFGDGGEAIYQADLNALNKALEEYSRLSPISWEKKK